MEPEFWHGMWQENRIGFHETRVNRLLQRHWHAMEPAPDTAVLVPMCGKSVDMHWLAEQGHSIIGVDLSPLAIEAFLHEHQLEATPTPLGELQRYETGSYRVYAGDFFALESREAGPINLVYDRAALIALPASMRPAYARNLQKLLNPTGKILLVTLEYAQSQMNGPPFGVHRPELLELFGENFTIQRLAVREMLDEEPRFRDRGVTALSEAVYRLAPRS